MAELAEQIKHEIRKSNLQAIPFRRFMELSLYHPTEGYYCRDRLRFGKQGDFFTNVQVGRLFAQILGHIFYQYISAKSTTDDWAIAELGAGDGQFMREIISFFHAKPINHVDYYLVERGQKRIEAVDQSVAQWTRSLDEVPRYPSAIVFSNELVDAFPVHRLQKHQGEIKEIFVAWDERTDAFREVLHDCSLMELADYAADMLSLVAEGQSFEVNLEAKHWLTQVAHWLNEGYLITIDYGGSTKELLWRPNGTLRYFQKHQQLNSSYHQLGEVDITASVDFTRLQSWGEELGLQTIFYGSQTKFFLNADLTAIMTAKKQIEALKQLVHPDAMGESFQVLVQQKITPASSQ